MFVTYEKFNLKEDVSHSIVSALVRLAGKKNEFGVVMGYSPKGAMVSKEFKDNPNLDKLKSWGFPIEFWDEKYNCFFV